MKVFLTKTWGFDEPCGPLQFGDSGRRESARRDLRTGDLVVIVGTKGEPTAERDRGMVLGLMQPSTIPVPSSAYRLSVRQIDLVGDRYRWPFALKIHRAWRFDEPRWKLEDITARRFNMDAASGIVELEQAEAAAILALPRTEIEVMQEGAVDDHPMGVARKRAPPPWTTRRGVMHLRNSRAFTYLMSVTTHRSLAFKIGWAFDVALRVRQFNRASMPSLGGAAYKAILACEWPSARRAFHMEQTLLRRFDSRRHEHNSEILHPVTHGDIMRAWIEYERSPPPLAF